MFNEERKRWFINDSDYIASTVWVLEQLFNTTERIENQKNKDLCEFSPKDVIDLLRSFNSKSRKTLGSKCSYLAKYYNWCLQKGFTDDIENKFETSIVKNVIEDLVPADMLNRKIFTFKDIDELITDIPQVEYKCFIYCIFSGLSIQDIRYLRMQDYDNNTNELKLNTGRIFKPDKLLYNLMAQTDSLEYFDKYGDGSTLEGRYKFKYKYSPSEYVFKNSGANNKSIDGAISIGVYNRFLREVQRYFNNKNITYSNLHKSGLINFIKEKYEAKDVTMKEVFTKMKNNREYEYDSETQEYIYEFGEKITTRMLRMDIIDIVDQL